MTSFKITMFASDSEEGTVQKECNSVEIFDNDSISAVTNKILDMIHVYGESIDKTEYPCFGLKFEDHEDHEAMEVLFDVLTNDKDATPLEKLAFGELCGKVFKHNVHQSDIRTTNVDLEINFLAGNQNKLIDLQSLSVNSSIGAVAALEVIGNKRNEIIQIIDSNYPGFHLCVNINLKKLEKFYIDILSSDKTATNEQLRDLNGVCKILCDLSALTDMLRIILEKIDSYTPEFSVN